MTVVDSFPRPVRQIENCWIPLSDGCRLAARIWLPEDADKRPVPAIFEYIPYRKRDFTRARDEPMHGYFAGHGYACVRVDLRGAGDSDGVLRDEYTQQELDDACEAIAWIAERSWCTGAVGMMGISWGGFNALQVAALRPPALKAIITLCSTDDRYADDAHYMGGCVLNENLTWGTVLLSFNALPPDPQVVGSGWRDAWLRRLEASVLFPEVWLAHQTRDEYWQHGSVCEDYSAIECPVYAIGGWADGYSNAVPRLLAGLSAPCKGLVGPWAHNFPHDGVPGPAIGFLQEALRWWDHCLKGEDNGVLDEPRYRVWMQDSVPPSPTRAEWPGRWVAEQSWPSPRILPTRMHLNAAGLGDAPVDGEPLRISSPQTAGLAAGDWCAFGSEGEMPMDQLGDDGKSLTFDSEPLADRLEILGAPVVTLELSADQPHALVAVRLCDIAPDGSSARVTYGLLNLTHRDGRHDRAEPLVPGGRHRVRVQLNDVAHAFPPGHRLRVAVSTSYWPIAWPSPRPVLLTVTPGASSLELPVRPPDPQDAALREFERPERAPPVEHARLLPSRFRRTMERDLQSGETVYTVFSSEGDFEGAAVARVEAIDLDVGYTQLRRYRIDERDPLSARAEVQIDVTLRRREWSVQVRVWVRMRASESAFRLHGDLTAFEGGRPAFERSWDLELPRRGV